MVGVQCNITQSRWFPEQQVDSTTGKERGGGGDVWVLVALTRSAQAAFHQLSSLPPASRWVLNHINGSSSERGNLALKIPFQKKGK